jgi:sugar phosphate permease
VFYLIKEKGVSDAAQAAMRVSGLELGGLLGSLIAGRLSDMMINKSEGKGGAVGKRVQVRSCLWCNCCLWGYTPDDYLYFDTLHTCCEIVTVVPVVLGKHMYASEGIAGVKRAVTSFWKLPQKSMGCSSSV